MAKRRNSWTEEKIAKYIAEGRGQGELSAYKPWLTIQNVPSTGRAHRLKGWKTNRLHHLLSDLECNYFYLSDWADNVIDIREQFPLDRETTLQIAEQKNIAHPVDRETNTPIVMTTDFLITVRENDNISYLARTTKMSKDLENKRTIEKFEIERQYWENQNVDWGIVTEQDINKTFAQNISWVHTSRNNNLENFDLMCELYAFLKKTDSTVFDAVTQFDGHYALEKGTSLNYFKSLVANKYLSIDMTTPFKVKMLVSDLEFPKEP